MADTILIQDNTVSSDIFVTTEVIDTEIIINTIFPDSSGGGGGGTTDVTKVPLARTITINGTSFDLSSNRSWTIGEPLFSAADVNLVKINGTYTDPSWLTSLAASKITLDSTHRFVTDAEKTTWNSKQDAGDYALNSALAGKQNTLVSGTNIKTINGASILGSGDMTIAGAGGDAGYTAMIRSDDRSIAIGSGTTFQSSPFVIGDAFGGLPVLAGYQAIGSGVAVGYKAQASNHEAVAIGPQAYADGLATIAIGDGTKSFTNLWDGNGVIPAGFYGNQIVMGDAAYARGNLNYFIGGGAGIDHNFVIALGAVGSSTQYNKSVSTADHQGFLGWYQHDSQYFSGGSGFVNDWWLGGPITAATPHDISLNMTNRTGTNTAGVNFTINGGRGSGTGTPGAIIFTTGTANGTPGSIQPVQERLRISESGVKINTVYTLPQNVGSAGQILKTDGIGGTSWSGLGDIGNVAIGGTGGTTGLYIERNNNDGGATQNAPTFLLKNTNPTDPAGAAYNLAAGSFSAGNGAVLLQLAANYGVSAGGSSGTPFNYGSAGIIGTRTNHPLIFITSATSLERMRIASDGTVSVKSLEGTGVRRVNVNAAGQLSADTENIFTVGGTAPSIRLEPIFYNQPFTFAGVLPATLAGRIIGNSGAAMVMQGFSSGAALPGYRMQGYVGSTAPTVAPFVFESFKSNGGTDRAALGASETAFSFYNGAYDGTGTILLSLAGNGIPTFPGLAGTGTQSLVADASGNVSRSTIVGFTDEAAQDAIGAMVSSEFNYVDGTPLLAINTIAQSKITGLSTTLAGKADLVGGIVSSSQLPSSVVGIVTVANFASLPGTGAANTIYITSDNNKRYIYSTTYIELGATAPVTSVNSATGDVVLTAASVGAIPSTRNLTINGTTLNLSADRTFSVGTVTSTSVVNANGFNGSFATGTTTPALTISTTVTGILKGNATAISAASPGSDYSAGTSLLGTGILKSTTGTGGLSIAVAGDFPTLNQSTTGTAANITGVLNAASHPALTGDVTSVQGALGTTIANNVVTNAKLATAPANTIKGNGTGATANVTDLTTIPVSVLPAFTGGDATSSAGSTTLTLGTVNANTGQWGTVTQVPQITVNGKGLITAVSHLGIQIAESQVTNLVADLALKAPLASPSFTGTVVVPDASFGVLKLSATGTKDATTYLAGDNTWKTIPAGGGGVTDGDKGDITVTGTGATWTIDNGVVTLAKHANMATASFLGRNTAGAGAPEELSVATTKTMLAIDQLNNTTDANKPVSTAQQTALNLKADLASPTFSGTPTLPTGTIASTQAGADSSTKIATTAYVQNAITRKSYNVIAAASSSHTAARAAGTYGMFDGDVASVTATGTLFPLKLIRITNADWPTADGITSKMNLQVILAVNDVAPTGNYTFGLYPITRPATSGGVGVNIYTMGTVVTGSTVLFTAPAADGLLTGVSGDFVMPADGFYAIGFVSTAAVAASSHLHMVTFLRYRNN